MLRRLGLWAGTVATTSETLVVSYATVYWGERGDKRRLNRLTEPVQAVAAPWTLTR